MSKKAILVVSFGTSHEDTRRVTIDAIVNAISQAFPDFAIYQAWTSKMIIKKLATCYGITVPTVSEALAQMQKDGVTHLVVQPTHVINGIENDLMKSDVLAYRDSFEDIRFGAPLLTSTEDSFKVIDAIAGEFSALENNQALVLMGHGTEHYANSIYAALDYTFKDKGFSNIFIGTVEAYPCLESLMRQIKAFNPKDLILAPFMIVAGDHAKNDMAGSDADSWASQFKAEGYTVHTVLKGLGEYPQIRQIFIDHINDVLED